ncbi:spore protease YyaC [Bacillaceae bacterium]
MNRNEPIPVPPRVPYRIDYADDYAVEKLSQNIYQRICSHPVPFDEIVMLCIGTDRSTGDSLGPLVGSKLKNRVTHCAVYGTLDEPVHAVNLEETLCMMQARHPNTLIIAIDACLGQFHSVGKITVADGPLKPGAGVKKNLPEVGDFHLTGIVNVGGFMEYFVLQNTRLGIVMRMADVIASSLALALEHYWQTKREKTSWP